jgi:hypothetical protein
MIRKERVVDTGSTWLLIGVQAGCSCFALLCLSWRVLMPLDSCMDTFAKNQRCPAEAIG